MINKILYLLISIIICSCVQDLPLLTESDNMDLNNENIDWFYDMNNQDLFIQIDINQIGLEDISHIYIKLSNVDGDFYEIFDDGQDGDIVSGNGLYSILYNDIIESDYILDIRLDFEGSNTFNEYQYEINFNAPSIINDSFYPVIPIQHILNDNEVTFFNMILAINDSDGQSDIEFVKFYIKKVSFFNATFINGVCDYSFVEENEYIWDPTWEMDYIGINENEEFVYNSQIPMNPIQSNTTCGGFGTVQFKFEVQDSKGFKDVFELEDLVEICPGVCE